MSWNIRAPVGGKYTLPTLHFRVKKIALVAGGGERRAQWPAPKKPLTPPRPSGTLSPWRGLKFKCPDLSLPGEGRQKR